ncbi:MAG: replication initiation protein [Desulfovibrio sp.]|jgi:hypothetical protein|nr:replication initiation protein [Desulfovibrio sp.]
MNRYLPNIFSWCPSSGGEALVRVKSSKSSAPVDVPSTQIAEWKYIYPNPYRYSFVFVDVDDFAKDDKVCALDIQYYNQRGVLMPTIITLTDRGAHILYALKFPVKRHGRGFNFYRRVRDSLITALNGDFACAATAACRNPFYTGAQSRIFPEKKYELADIYVANQAHRSATPAYSTEYADGNRNRSTFMHTLAFFKRKPDSDLQALIEVVEAFQAEQQDAPLSREENMAICRSVLRNSQKYSASCNRGVLQLPPRTASLPLEQFKSWRSERQALGAEYARAQRSEAVAEKVRTAQLTLAESGVKVTAKAVAELAVVNRRTAQKYMR